MLLMHNKLILLQYKILRNIHIFFILQIIFLKFTKFTKLKAYNENYGKHAKNIDHHIKILFDFKTDTDSYSCKKLFVLDQSQRDCSLYLKAANTKGKGSRGCKAASICTEH